MSTVETNMSMLKQAHAEGTAVVCDYTKAGSTMRRALVPKTFKTTASGTTVWATDWCTRQTSKISVAAIANPELIIDPSTRGFVIEPSKPRKRKSTSSTPAAEAVSHESEIAPIPTDSHEYVVGAVPVLEADQKALEPSFLAEELRVRAERAERQVAELTERLRAMQSSEETPIQRGDDDLVSLLDTTLERSSHNSVSLQVRQDEKGKYEVEVVNGPWIEWEDRPQSQEPVVSAKTLTEAVAKLSELLA